MSGRLRPDVSADNEKNSVCSIDGQGKKCRLDADRLGGRWYYQYVNLNARERKKSHLKTLAQGGQPNVVTVNMLFQAVPQISPTYSYILPISLKGNSIVISYT